MNTRIQVEHPVTEVVTGLDLVEWMIRIAAGEHLGMAQEELRMDGWAVEARVYAEDPRRNFLPSIGRLVRYREPSEGSDGSGRLCRIDSGVVEGSEITMFYDPMIAKVIGSGASREDAIDTLRLGLDSFVIRGIDHNIEFLCAVLGHERFRNGDLSTDFIEEVYPQGFAGASVDPGEQAILVAMAAVLHSLHEWRLNARRGATSQQWTVIAGSLHFPALVENLDKKYRVTISNKMKILIEGDVSLAQHLLDCHVNGERVVVQAEPRGHAIRVSRGGVSLDCLVVTPETAELARNYMPDKESHDLSRYLLSPMPGLLVSLAVGAGQEVKAGEELAVVEAMKMENILRAERDGTVKTLHAAPGDSLAVDQAIIEFEEG